MWKTGIRKAKQNILKNDEADEYALEVEGAIPLVMYCLADFNSVSNETSSLAGFRKLLGWVLDPYLLMGTDVWKPENGKARQLWRYCDRGCVRL